MVLLGGRVERFCRVWLFVLAWLLMGSAAQARVATDGIGMGTLPSLWSGEPVTVVFQERHAQQLIRATGQEQEKLLLDLALQFSKSLNTASSKPTAYPAVVVRSWLRTLLDKKLPQDSWPPSLTKLAQSYAMLDRYMSSTLGVRREHDGLLNEANTLRLAGHFARADELVRRVLQRADQNPLKSSDESRLLRRYKAELLMLSAGLAFVQLEDVLGADRALAAVDLREDNADVEVGSWLLLAGEYLAIMGAQARALDSLERLNTLARQSLEKAPQFTEWNRLRWLAQYRIGDIQSNLGEQRKAIASYRLAWELSAAQRVLDTGDATALLVQWATLAKLVDMQSRLQDVEATTRYVHLLLEKGQAMVDHDAGNPWAWAALCAGQFMVAEMHLFNQNMVSGLALHKSALRSAERWVALDGGSSLSLQAQWGSLSRIDALDPVAADPTDRLARKRAEVDVTERLVALYPDDPQWAIALKQAYFGLVDVLALRGDDDRVVEALQAGLAATQRDLEKPTTPATNWAYELRVFAHGRLGDRQMALGELDGAIRHYRDAIEIAKKVAQSNEAYDWQASVSEIQFDLARALAQKGEQDAAHEAMLVREETHRRLTQERKKVQRDEAYLKLTPALRDIELTFEEAAKLPDEALVLRLQAGVDRLLDRARTEGMTQDLSETLRKMRNALAAIRFLED